LGLISRRKILQIAGMTAGATILPRIASSLEVADATIEIAPYSLEVGAGHFIKTIAYNQQVPGPLLRLKENVPVMVDVVNHSDNEEMVHWHGLFLPPDVDGSMEEGTPHVPKNGRVRYTFSPRPAGFRWYHTHTFAGHDLKRGGYTGQHGFLLIEPKDNPARYDKEIFLSLHDWNGTLAASNDGSMNPSYQVSTINGRQLGFGEPLRVKQGERVLLHVLNSSATEAHWIAMAGHQFEVIALDGNAVAQPKKVPMLRLSPAERVCAVVEMNHPGAWLMGEVRKHVMAAGMGIVVEYAGSSGKPQWVQPENLVWDYLQFGIATSEAQSNVKEIPLVFESKFAGHGAMDRWMINGKSFPDTRTEVLTEGQRYRLIFRNKSTDDHPVHLHRHSFELRRIQDGPETNGVLKDTVLVAAGTEVAVEFTADHPGMTLFHCHQQDHMDNGFMMLFRYA
jgi:FtsP/CotA-like multicopper oxidase with cupredoxin domain